MLPAATAGCEQHCTAGFEQQGWLPAHMKVVRVVVFQCCGQDVTSNATKPFMRRWWPPPSTCSQGGHARVSRAQPCTLCASLVCNSEQAGLPERGAASLSSPAI